MGGFVIGALQERILIMKRRETGEYNC